MIQPYGAHPLGDLGGLAFIALAYVLLCCVAPTLARVWVLAAAVASLIGSAGVFASALSRGDLGVAAYHLAWVVASAAMARWALLRLRDGRRTGDGTFGGRRVSDRVVVTALGPNWDRLIGVDQRGNPVYQ